MYSSEFLWTDDAHNVLISVVLFISLLMYLKVAHCTFHTRSGLNNVLELEPGLGNLGGDTNIRVGRESRPRDRSHPLLRFRSARCVRKVGAPTVPHTPASSHTLCIAFGLLKRSVIG